MCSIYETDILVRSDHSSAIEGKLFAIALAVNSCIVETGRVVESNLSAASMFDSVDLFEQLLYCLGFSCHATNNPCQLRIAVWDRCRFRWCENKNDRDYSIGLGYHVAVGGGNCCAHVHGRASILISALSCFLSKV